MQNAIILGTNDIKEIIAEKYDVPVKNVVKSQYSFTVVMKKEEGKKPAEQVTTEESSTAAPPVGG